MKDEPRHYATAVAFRRALETRLKTMTQTEGIELNYILEFLGLIEFQRHHSYLCTARVSRMDRAGLVAKVIHGLALGQVAARQRLAP